METALTSSSATSMRMELRSSSHSRTTSPHPRQMTSYSARKTLLFLFVLECVLLVHPYATAQDQPAQPAPPTAQDQPTKPEGQPSSPDTQRHFRRTPTLDEQLKTLTDRLNLDATQQGMVKIILERRQSELLDVYKNQSLSAIDRFNAMKEVHERANDRISRLLNPEQSKKFDLMRHHTPQPQDPAKSDRPPSARSANPTPARSDN